MPWEFHEDLSQDRLQLVAKILRDARRDALALHDPRAGDTSWSLGCRIYARSTEMLSRAAESLLPWLTVIQPPLEFVFGVGAVPLRFFHGDAEHPGEAHLQVTGAEAAQRHLAFGEARTDLIWRIVVQTNVAGEAEDIVLIGSTRAENVECRFVIPSLKESVSFFEPMKSRGKGVELPAPVVTSRGKKLAKDDDGGSEV